MKKIIIFALAALMMVGCDCTPEGYTTSDGVQVRVVLIDSCEYVRWSNGYGPHYAHKGNCKFCTERRKQELKELAEQLKGK